MQIGIRMRGVGLFFAPFVVVAGVAPAAADEQLDGLLKQLVRADDNGERAEVGKSLRKLPDQEKVVVQLMERLKGENAEQRFAAAIALGIVGRFEEDSVNALFRAFGDDGFTVDGRMVWAAAARTVGQMPEPPIDRLAELFDAKNKLHQRAALIAVGFAGRKAKRLTPDLIRVMKRDENETRREAISALREIGPDAKEAVGDLLVMLGHADFHTRYWTCRALGAIGPPARRAVPKLIEMVGKEITSVRGNAALALGGIGPDAGEAALSALGAALSDRHQTVRERAAQAIGRWGARGKPAAEELRKLLSHDAAESRIYAAHALAQVGEHLESARSLLVAELKGDQYPWLAAEGIALLGRAAEPAHQDLIGALRTLNPEVRTAAAKSLGKLRVKAALETLEQMAKVDLASDAREAAAQAAAEIRKADKQ